MTKAELIEAIAKERNLSSQEAKSAVDIILETMTEALIRGKNVEIRGFGSFRVHECKVFTEREPRSGEEVNVLSTKRPIFKMGKDLREKMSTFKQ